MAASDKHYSFDYKGIRIDPYRLFNIYNITDPCQQHAIKKLLRAGQSVKSLTQDIDEVIMTLQRWKGMLEEDAVPTTLPLAHGGILSFPNAPIFPLGWGKVNIGASASVRDFFRRHEPLAAEQQWPLLAPCLDADAAEEHF